MADGASLTFPDLPKMLAELRTLPDIFQRRLMLGAVATGCSVIRKAAQARAAVWDGPVSAGHPPPGTLRASIYQVRMKEECTATQEVWKVDVRAGKLTRKAKGKSITKAGAYYATWVEFGHYVRERGTTRKGHKAAIAIGKARFVPAQPFMRPAFESSKQAAMAAMQGYMVHNLPAATGALKYLQARALA